MKESSQLTECIELMKEGYGIGIEHYPKHKTTIYSFLKVDNPKERTIKFECARDIATLLRKHGAKIVYRQPNCNALNFVPEPTRKGCITYWTS